MKLMTDGRKALLAGVALAACLGFTMNAQAQTCVISNWAGGATGLTNTDAGVQGSENRRYGGPCGLRVDVDGTPRFVSDNSPAGSTETTYIARFYAFLDNAGSNPVLLFAADDGTNDQIQVWYNSPSAGALTLRVFDNSATPVAFDLTEASVGSGWHSIEFKWQGDANPDIRFSVDGAADLVHATVPDTSTLYISNAYLGNVNGAAGGGSIDFDDFDSRRIERPGRLLVGDSNSDGTVNVFDIIANIDESQSGIYAAGQPDCDENGSINVFDIICQIDIIQ